MSQDFIPESDVTNNSRYVLSKSTGGQVSQEPKELTIKDFARVLFMYKMHIIAICLMVMTGAAFTVFWIMSPTYESKARVHVDLQSGAIPVMRGAGMFVSDAEKLGFFETVMQELKNPAIIEQVVDSLDLGETRVIGNIEMMKNRLLAAKRWAGKLLGIASWQKPQDPAAVSAAVVLSNYSVNRLSNSTILELVYRCKNPVECRNTLSLLIRMYIRYRDSFLQEKAIGTSEFLSSELVRARNEIEKAENDLLKLTKKDVLVMDLGERQDGSGSRRTHVFGMTTNNLAIEELKLQIVRMNEQRDRLLSEYTQSHPTIERLNRTIKKYAKLINKAPTIQLQMGRLKRDINSKEMTYRELSAARDNAIAFESRSLAKLNTIKLIKMADLPGGAVAPKKMLAMIASVFLGLLLGFIYSFIIDFIDRTIKKPDDISEHIGIPCISSIPNIRK